MNKYVYFSLEDVKEIFPEAKNVWEQKIVGSNSNIAFTIDSVEYYSQTISGQILLRHKRTLINLKKQKDI